MLNALKLILEIQELDMKMIRLMRLKRERQKELDHIDNLRTDLQTQLVEKQQEIEDLNRQITEEENKIEQIKETLKKLEAKQSTVKKVDEFNALTQEMTQAERTKIATENATSDLIDRRNLEDEILTKIKESLEQTEESSKALEKEIRSSIKKINEEGQEIHQQRHSLVKNADAGIFPIYERLLRNKRDRVVVPIENRTCSGCHIALTAQHENLVRKGERIVFCEHCSRIHFWQESSAIEETTVATKRRRRRATTTN